MKFHSITAVSLMALMLSLPAYAADVSGTGVAPETTPSAAPSPGDSQLKKSLTEADKDMRDTAEDIKAFFVGKEQKGKLEPVLIHRNTTAQGMIGQTIVNPKGEKIATVKDIIIGKDGKAILVVVSDHGVMGIGDKVAAFDYNKVVTQNPDGKVVMALSQDMVDRAADFSYDQSDWAKAKVIPAGSISANVLLEGNVVDSSGDKVADIENVYFRNAEASQLIVGFNKTLGMGGDLAALNYDDLQMIRDKKELDFKLTPNQAAAFKSFKKSVAN
jgi:sporulation protein YlmC with PRC-barrel domain